MARAWDSDPVVLTVAVTGADVFRENNPNIPYTTAEIADSAIAAAAAGATLAHLHVREDDGAPSGRPELFVDVVERIRAGSQLLTMVSTGGVADTSAVIPAASEQPLTWQVSQYLAQHGSFNANQLVLVEGGANEILALLDNSGAGLTAFATALAKANFTAAASDPATQQKALAQLEAEGFTAAQAQALVPAAIALFRR